MEAATAAAFVAVAPLTISGYAHIKECFGVSQRRCKETPKLFKDAFQSPAQQLRLRAKEYKLGGPVTLSIDGHPAGEYLEFNGEILLVGETPEKLTAVAAVGGATVTSEATSIVLAWQVPRELKLQFKSEDQALEWTKALRDASRLPHHPARLKMLIEHIHLQDMHNRDLQFRVDRAMEDYDRLERHIESGGHEKKLGEVEERLRAANTHMEHHKMRADLAESKLRDLQTHEHGNEKSNDSNHHRRPRASLDGDTEQHRCPELVPAEGEEASALTRTAGGPGRSAGVEDTEVLMLLETTEKKSRALEQRSAALEQRLMAAGHQDPAEVAQLQEQCERQRVELEQLRVEVLASRQAAQAAEETRAVQMGAAQQQSQQLMAELEQLRAEVSASRQAQALLESEKQQLLATQSASRKAYQVGENGHCPNDVQANEQNIQTLMMRVMEAETKAAELRVAAEQCENQTVELEQLRSEVLVSREVEQGAGGSRGQLKEALQQCERQAAELQHLQKELSLSRQEAQEAEALRQQLAGAPASDLLQRLQETEAAMAQLQAVSDAKERRVARLESLLMGTEEALLQRAIDAEVRAEELQITLGDRESELERVKAGSHDTSRPMLVDSPAEENEALLRRAADAEVRLDQFQVALEEKDREVERFRALLVEAEGELTRLRNEAAGSAAAIEAVRQEARKESNVSREMLQRITFAEARAEQLQQTLADRELHLEHAKAQSVEVDEELLRLRSDRASSEEAIRLLHESNLEKEALLQRTANAEVQLEQSQTVLIEKDRELERLRAGMAESAETARQAALQESDYLVSGAEAKVAQLAALVNEKVEHIRQLEERVEADAAGKEALRAAEEMVNVQVAAEREAVSEALQQRAAAEQELSQLRAVLVDKDTQITQLVEEAKSAAAQAHELHAREAQTLIRFEEEKLTLRRHVEVQFEAKYTALRTQAAQAEKELQTVGQERDVLKLRLQQAEGKVLELESRPVVTEREVPPAIVQRLAASELDAEEAKVKLGTREQELTVARQTIERQRQECEALRLQGAEAMKALDNQRSAQQQSLGEVDQEARVLAARLTRMEQEKAVLQEQLSERTMAYQRELADVSVKMKLLEAALVNNPPEGSAQAFTQPSQGFTQPALANLNQVYAQPALEGPVVQIQPVQSQVEKLSPVQELRALSQPQLGIQQTPWASHTSAPPPFQSLPPAPRSRAASPLMQPQDLLQSSIQMRPQEQARFTSQDSFMTAAAVAVQQRAASPPAAVKRSAALPMGPAVASCNMSQVLLPPTSGAAPVSMPPWHLTQSGGSISHRSKPEGPPPLHFSWSPNSPSSPAGAVPGAISGLTPTSDNGANGANSMRPLSFDRIYSELPASPLATSIIPHK